MSQVLKIKKSVVLDVNEVDDEVSDTKQTISEVELPKNEVEKQKLLKSHHFLLHQH